MEEFTEECSHALQAKEWLVKIDNSHSVPYLLKFGSSEKTDTCFLLITDTKTVWTEVLTRSQIARRWRQCNPSLSSSDGNDPFDLLLSLVRDLHTPGGISDSNFEIVESRDADLAFELDCDKFKWRWDAYLLGPKTSADIISKQLILPLISLAHVSFYSADPVSELTEGDLEKTVDKIGRTARRSVDIHVKQTLSRPRIATTLQRISSLLGLVQTLPPIASEAEAPDLEDRLKALSARIPTSSDETSRRSPATLEDARPLQEVQNTIPPKPIRSSVDPGPAAGVDSATESDSDDDDNDDDINAPRSKESQGSSPKAPVASHADPTSEPPTSRQPSRPQSSRSDSPPAKRVKGKVPKESDSDSDSDSDSRTKGRSQGSQGTSGGTRPIIGRGVRQPLKRGGRRF